MEEHIFKDQVAIVTGGSSGIGEATALALADRGASVAITGRDRPRLDRVAAKRDAIMAIQADSADPASAGRIVEAVMGRWNRLDMLVNNAGAGVLVYLRKFDDTSTPVSITIEENGTMLLGTEVEAAVAALAPYGPVSFGLNCATGPDLMREPLSRLLEAWDGPVSVMPNAGIPELVEGETVFPLTPEELATALAEFVDLGVGIVGGCCGTTAAHMVAVVEAVEGKGLTGRAGPSGSSKSSGRRGYPLPLAASTGSAPEPDCDLCAIHGHREVCHHLMLMRWLLL